MNKYTYLGAATAGVLVTAWAVLAGMGMPVDNAIGGVVVGVLTGSAATAGAMKK